MGPRSVKISRCGGLLHRRFKGKISPMLAPSFNTVPSPEPRPRYQPLVIVLVAVVGGVAVDRFWPLSLAAWWAIAVGGLTLWVVPPLICHRPCHDAVRWLFFGNVALLLSVAATAAAWHHCRWYLFAADDLGRYTRDKGQPVYIEAIAVEAPRAVPTPAPDPMRTRPMGDCSRFAVDLAALRNGSTWQPVSGRTTLLVQGLPPKIAPGDRLRCFGRLDAPPSPRNPGAFDIAARSRAYGVLSRLKVQVPQCLTMVETGGWLNFARVLDRVRAGGNRLLAEYLDPRHAGMAAAVLLGERGRIDGGRRETFAVTGSIHLLVISGLHLGILAGALFWVLRRTPLPRGWTIAMVAAVMIFYTLLVDAGPPVVRAAVLVLVLCAATYSGRHVLSFNSLAAAALVVLTVNPSNLFHTGSQLSFLAVAGLMWFAPHWLVTDEGPLKRLIVQNAGWLQRRRWAVGHRLRSLALVSATIWLLAMPLVMARFHLFNPVAVLLNTVAWLPMACGLMSGFALLIVGDLLPPLAYVLGDFCNLNLWLLEWLVMTARRVPGGHVWAPGPADWWLWGFYGGLGLLAAFPCIRPPRRWCVGLLAMWVAVGFTAAQWQHDAERLDCTFLSMGHGCAVLLELPPGGTVLYDAGQFGSSTAGMRAVSEFLWSRGLTHLDAVVLSHADIDHYNALPGLLERFSVGVVYVSPVIFENTYDSCTVARLRAAIERHGVPIREVCAGDRLQGGNDCRLEVLHPTRHGVLGTDNANSLVLAVEYCGHRILLTGDIESPGLDDLLAEEPLHCDVLLAPHHGSRKSNSPKLAAWCRPHWVVCSGDGRWSLPEIETTYRAVGGQTLHTSQRGAIHVSITPRELRVSPMLVP